MTLPHERTLAVLRASEFMRDLMNPKKTPRVPLAVRRRAMAIWKHYPWKMELHTAADLAPNIFGKPE